MKNRILIAAAAVLIIAAGALLGGVFRESPSAASAEIAQAEQQVEDFQAGFKLNDLCRYYWQTRDASVVRDLRPRWEKEARRLAGNRTENGLYPKEQYCGDISTFVYSLNVNSKAWRALRDLAPVLAECGDAAEAKEYEENAASFRKVILDAIGKNAHRETSPPFPSANSARLPYARLEPAPGPKPLPSSNFEP